MKFSADNLKLVEHDYSYGALKVTDVLTALSALEDAERAYDRMIYVINFDFIKLEVMSGSIKLPEGTLP